MLIYRLGVLGLTVIIAARSVPLQPPANNDLKQNHGLLFCYCCHPGFINMFLPASAFN